MGRRVLETLIAIVVTLGLVYASYWLWSWAPVQLKGTPFSSFGALTSVIAIFLMLSVVDLLFGWIGRLVEARED